MNKIRKSLQAFMLLGCLLCVTGQIHAEYLDSIVAVVEDDVILNSELKKEIEIIKQNIAASNLDAPPDNILYPQIMERLIISKLQRILAERSGIKINDDMLQTQLDSIARQNNMSPEQFEVQVTGSGMDYNEFKESVRNEIIINQLRGREIGERVKVTDREVEHYLETQSGDASQNIKYHLGHILIAVPEGAESEQIQKARKKAKNTVQQLRDGSDFNKMAIAISDGAQALQGGDLGWRKKSQMPTIFLEEIDNLQSGMVSDPIRSPSGFHIIKMMDIEGLPGSHLVTKTKARHILIKTNELVDDKEARHQLTVLRERIIGGDDFATLAKSHSDDTASALKGGDLGWVSPGALVAPFEKAMNRLQPGQISEPVQTQFGWHLIQVQEREQQDDSEQYKKELAREEIRKRKIEEETELWLRRLRDEAYVDIRIGKR